MIIVWDEPKREANLAKHGIDFADIGESFFASAIVRPSRAGRFAAFGELNGKIAVIFLALGTEGISIISARPASRKERRLMP
ncbi:BrnT family toxin [Sphingomonas abietis]|uniref:BrnT family toxin n=1 Tax=Sphingomonas abietis TaxID=3012344 RepID=A0ABY7NMA2_9SPHN|nr:BrnT family toxin [Sphingomonas abietis]WBO22100.1 BrnT family toxin [Sphingomonas abietis]